MATATRTVPPVLRVFEHWITGYRRTWYGTAVSSVLEPVLFLTAIGVGLGTLVDQNGQLSGGTDYLAFLAPGLLAASAMQIGAMESTYPVMGGVKWDRRFHAMLDAPLTVRAVMLGHQLFVLFRVASSCLVYLAVIAVFGALDSWLGILAWPVAVLTGMAYAAPVAAFAATRESDRGFAALFRFGVLPMFLFSATFFPIEQLPDLIQPVAYVVPLWHGVTLCRALAEGTPDLGAAAVHIGYLALWVVVGLWLAERAFRRRLVT